MNKIMIQYQIHQGKQKLPNRNELPNLENGNATLPNNAQRSNHKEILSQEQKFNRENVKRIVKSLFYHHLET